MKGRSGSSFSGYSGLCIGDRKASSILPETPIPIFYLQD
jgi:hypothetical protein